MLAFRFDYSTAALPCPQKVLSIQKLIELKTLDFSDRARTVVSILTSATDTALRKGHIYFSGVF